MKIRVKNNSYNKLFVDKIFKTKHFENILLILLKQDYKMNEGKHKNMLLDGTIIRAIITDTPGKKNKLEKNSIYERLL